LVYPFAAATYSHRHRAKLDQLAVPDLDTVDHLWGGVDSSRAFRNVLVGTPEKRGEIWQAWISGGDIDLADEQCFYVYRQREVLEGRTIDRWSLFCAVDIASPNLYIHEDTLSEGVERARQAAESCESDMAPLFVGCEEGVGRQLRALLAEAVEKRAPLLSYRSGPDQSHEVWVLESPILTNRIGELFHTTPLFLLDGHHRLAAAKANQKLGLGDGKILASICSMGTTDTLILPIHRLISYDRWILPEALYSDLSAMGASSSDIPELRVGGIGSFLETFRSSSPFCLVLHSYGDRPKLVQLPHLAKLSRPLASLAVANLDFGILSEIPQATVMPAPHLNKALEQLAQDQAQVGFFLPSVKPSEVRAVAQTGLRMPRKSTRFFPKPALGLVTRPWTSGAS
jgi:hypothetical protein